VKSIPLQTTLTLVVADVAGHDPLKATGLVLAHLPGICKRTRPDVAQLWVLRAVARAHAEPWAQLEVVAEHQNTTADELFYRAKLSPEEMAQDPLAGE
jgi:hypothetical protein